VRIGIPRETAERERRVALVPDVVRRLLAAEHEVVVEPGLTAFEQAGDARRPVGRAEVVAKVAPPSEAEVAKLRSSTILVGFLNPLGNPAGLEAIAGSGATALAMEKIPRISRAQSMDALSSHGEWVPGRAHRRPGDVALLPDVHDRGGHGPAGAGPGAGGGRGDFCVAADDAKIGDFHIRRALFGGAGPIYRLPRYIGLRKTKELLLTGKLLSGRECEDWDLANVSAPADQLDQAVADFIAPMKDKSAFAMRITKLAANRGLDGDTETLIALESMTCNVAHQSEDAKEGVQAFLEKRDAVWRHR